MVIGLKAVRNIINGAEKIGKDLFVKKGNYQQALQDFHHLNPQGVKNIGEVIIEQSVYVNFHWAIVIWLLLHHIYSRYSDRWA